MRRTALFLNPQQRQDPSFYETLKQQRDLQYLRARQQYLATGNPFSHPTPYITGEIVKLRGWETRPENVLLFLAFSGFLLRSVDGDEQIHLWQLTQMNPKKLQLNPRNYMHTGLFVYGLGVSLVVAKAVGFIRHLSSDVSYYYRNPDEMAKFYVAGRLYMMLTGLFAAWFLYRIALAVADERIALTTAFLFLAAPVTIAQVHVIKGHIVGAAMAFVFVLGCFRLMREPRWRWYCLNGLWAGMMFGTQPLLWFICLFLPAAHIAGGLWLRRSPWRLILFDPKLWAAPCLGIAGFVILNPYIFTDFKEWYDGAITFGRTLQSTDWRPWTWPKAWLIGLGLGLNAACFIASAVGFLLTWRNFSRFTAEQRLLALFTAFNLLIFGVYCGRMIDDSVIQARRFLTLVGFLCLYAAWFLDRLRIGRKIVLAYTLTVALFLGYNLYADSRDSTYMQAGRWINENIAKRSSIGLRPYPHTNLTPPFDFAGYELWVQGSPESYLSAKELPDYFVLEYNPILYTPAQGMILPFSTFHDYYELIRRFGRAPDWSDFTNHFTTANFPVWIYKKRS